MSKLATPRPLVCGVGTCTRPSGHVGAHDAFDGLRAQDCYSICYGARDSIIYWACSVGNLACGQQIISRAEEEKRHPSPEGREAAKSNVVELEAELLALKASAVGLVARCAEKLADEVDVLVRTHKLDSRSPAADALLDYRNPPQTERSDRIVELGKENQKLKAATEEMANFKADSEQLVNVVGPRAQKLLLDLEEARHDIVVLRVERDTARIERDTSREAASSFKAERDAAQSELGRLRTAMGEAAREPTTMELLLNQKLDRCVSDLEAARRVISAQQATSNEQLEELRELRTRRPRVVVHPGPWHYCCDGSPGVRHGWTKFAAGSWVSILSVRGWVSEGLAQDINTLPVVKCPVHGGEPLGRAVAVRARP